MNVRLAVTVALVITAIAWIGGYAIAKAAGAVSQLEGLSSGATKSDFDPIAGPTDGSKFIIIGSAGTAFGIIAGVALGFLTKKPAP